MTRTLGRVGTRMASLMAMDLRRSFCTLLFGLTAAATVGGCYDSSATYRDRDYAARRAKEQAPDEDASQGGPDTKGDMPGKGRGGEHKEVIRANSGHK